MHPLLIILLILVAMVAVISFVAIIKQPSSVYKNQPEERNPMEGKKVIFVENEDEPANADGVRGHLEAVENAEHHAGIYEKYVKRLFDIVLSLGGLIVLSPIFLGLSIAIVIDDPGPVLFTQKRVGKNKQYFKLHKFRSMKMSTPHDRPTHMLENPEQYITKVHAGGILETTRVRPYTIRTFENDKRSLNSNFREKLDEVRRFRAFKFNSWHEMIIIQNS